MKHPRIITCSLLVAACPLFAQNLKTEHIEAMDPIEAAIEAFNNRSQSKPNEVVVVLDPPTANDKPKEGDAVLVTGSPQNGADQIEISDIPVDPEAAQDLPPALTTKSKGLAVRVQTLSKGTGKIRKDETVRLLAPFPAKPLDDAPEGWLLQTSEVVPILSREVEIAPGKSITLTIRPHVLVPDADQAQILAVHEPGFEASLGYRQSDTVSAVLSASLKRLDEDSRQIGDAIDQLQQLIVSLPKPEKAVPVPDGEAPAPDQP